MCIDSGEASNRILSHTTGPISSSDPKEIGPHPRQALAVLLLGICALEPQGVLTQLSGLRLIKRWYWLGASVETQTTLDSEPHQGHWPEASVLWQVGRDWPRPAPGRALGSHLLPCHPVNCSGLFP